MVIQPRIWDKYIIYDDGPGRTIAVSLIIKLIDAKTGNEPMGRIEVKIKKEEIMGIRDIRSVRSPSGYFIFTDLDDWNYPIYIDSELYLPVEKSIDMSTMKTLENLKMEFKVTGPLDKAPSAKLKNVSELQKGYFIEFRNPEDETEQRIIRDIDIQNNIISWKKGLRYKFSSPNSTIRVLNYLFGIFLKAPD